MSDDEVEAAEPVDVAKPLGPAAVAAAAQAKDPKAGPRPGHSRVEKRSLARLAAVQALYQMDVAEKGLNEVFAEFESHWMGREIEGEKYKPAEGAYFRVLVSGVLGEQRDVDPVVAAALAATWPLDRIEPLMRAVLRAGAYELMRREDVPARVVVSEYVDIAGAFYGREEVGMINAVLDRVSREQRGPSARAAG